MKLCIILENKMIFIDVLLKHLSLNILNEQLLYLNIIITILKVKQHSHINDYI